MKDRRILIGNLIAIGCLAPFAALANPVMVNPASLLAFWTLVFWAAVVESGNRKPWETA